MASTSDVAFLDALLANGFPGLVIAQCRVTSPRTRNYNCIAWTADDTARWWWPKSLRAYWPDWAPDEVSLAAFITAFEGLNYRRCTDSSLEPAVEKIAIYTLHNCPTHGARQLADGRWTSKLGELRDIKHTVTCMDGSVYGTAAVYMSRSRLHKFPDGEVAPIAYAIWQTEGRPHGRHNVHWSLALQTLMEQEEAKRGP